MVIEGDITDADKVNELGQYDFEKIINCAACAKHFSADDTLEIVNYQGVLNLIHLCGETGRELIQISAVSVAGENVREKIPKEKSCTKTSWTLARIFPINILIPNSGRKRQF